MNNDVRQLLKDATALGSILTAGGLFVLRASRTDDALSRAVHNAITGATLAAPLAGSYGFAYAKSHRNRADREEALEVTAIFGGLGSLGAGAACGIASLAWDAFHS